MGSAGIKKNLPPVLAKPIMDGIKSMEKKANDYSSNKVVTKTTNYEDDKKMESDHLKQMERVEELKTKIHESGSLSANILSGAWAPNNPNNTPKV